MYTQQVFKKEFNGFDRAQVLNYIYEQDYIAEQRRVEQENEINLLTQQLNAKTSQLKRLENEARIIDRRADEMQMIKDALTKADQANRLLQHENDLLQVRLANSVNAWEEERRELEAKQLEDIEQDKQKLNDLSEEIAQLRSKNEELEKALSQARDSDEVKTVVIQQETEIRRLREKSKQMTDMIDGIRNKFAELKSVNENLSLQLSRAQEIKKSYIERIEYQDAQLAESEQELQEALARLEHQKKVIAEQEANLKSLSGEYVEQLKQRDAVIAELKQRDAEYRLELTKKQGQLKQVQALFETQQQQIERKNLHIKSLENTNLTQIAQMAQKDEQLKLFKFIQLEQKRELDAKAKEIENLKKLLEAADSALKATKQVGVAALTVDVPVQHNTEVSPQIESTSKLAVAEQPKAEPQIVSVPQTPAVAQTIPTVSESVSKPVVAERQKAEPQIMSVPQMPAVAQTIPTVSESVSQPAVAEQPKAGQPKVESNFRNSAARLMNSDEILPFEVVTGPVSIPQRGTIDSVLNADWTSGTQLIQGTPFVSDMLSSSAQTVYNTTLPNYGGTQGVLNRAKPQYGGPVLPNMQTAALMAHSPIGGMDSVVSDEIREAIAISMSEQKELLQAPRMRVSNEVALPPWLQSKPVAKVPIIPTITDTSYTDSPIQTSVVNKGSESLDNPLSISSLEKLASEVAANSAQLDNLKVEGGSFDTQEVSTEEVPPYLLGNASTNRTQNSLSDVNTHVKLTTFSEGNEGFEGAISRNPETSGVVAGNVKMVMPQTDTFQVAASQPKPEDSTVSSVRSKRFADIRPSRSQSGLFKVTNKPSISELRRQD